MNSIVVGMKYLAKASWSKDNLCMIAVGKSIISLGFN